MKTTKWKIRKKQWQKKIRVFFSENNIYFIFIFFLIFACILVFKLYKIQVIEGERHNEKVLAQTKGYSLSQEKRRGTIFFQNHTQEKTAVALQNTAYVVAINPKYIADEQALYEKLSSVIQIDKDSFFAKAAKKDDPYEEVAHRVSEQEVTELKALGVKGVVFVKDSWRNYPFDEVSSHIIGFTNVQMEGTYGLEKFYEQILKRNREDKNKNIFLSFFGGSESNIFSEKVISKEGDLVSSVDIGLSFFVEKVLKKIDEKYDSQYSAAIIIQPHTGRIITMTDSETFDLNSDKQDFRNKFIEHRFEVGSIFKPLVASIGLDSGKIDQDFSYHDRGCTEVLNRTMCNFDKKGRGKGTELQTVISQSLNTGMIEIEKKIGHRIFLRYLLDLGLSEETGIDISGEIASNISNLIHDDNDVDYAAASFGQGIAFTPIGISRALSAIANDGYLVTPHIVHTIEYGGLIPSKEFVQEEKKVFSAQTIQTIKDILIERADSYAKDKTYFNKHYSVASKTGTAQIPSPDGGYYEDKNLHTYFGFFPANAKPENRYAIFLYTMDPKNVKYSSETMTEPFYEIVNFMIPYFKIRPDRVKLEL